jgi:hypothetical protein
MMSMHIIGVAHGAEEIAQFRIRLKRQRVLALGAVERDGGHAVGAGKQDVFAPVVGELAAVARQAVGLAAQVAVCGLSHGVSWVCS